MLSLKVLRDLLFLAFDVFSLFRARTKLAFVLIHAFQTQEMDSAETISGNNDAVILRKGACCHLPIYG